MCCTTLNRQGLLHMRQLTSSVVMYKLCIHTDQKKAVYPVELKTSSLDTPKIPLRLLPRPLVPRKDMDELKSALGRAVQACSNLRCIHHGSSVPFRQLADCLWGDMQCRDAQTRRGALANLMPLRVLASGLMSKCCFLCD